MFTKVVIFCAALAAVHASLAGPLSLGAPVLAAGSFGSHGSGLIAAAPAIATVSIQKNIINHVAPAARIAAAAPLGFTGVGLAGPIAAGALGYGANGLAAGALGHGAGLIASAPAVATVSTQRTAINHVAPAARIAAAAPLGLAGVGLAGPIAAGALGYGGPALATGAFGYGASALADGALGHGAGLIAAAPAVATVSTQRTAINHVAPAARIAAAPLGLAGVGLAGVGLAGPIANGALGYGAPVLAAGALGHGAGLIAAAPAIATVSTQRNTINHVAPAARAVAATPIALSNGLIAGNGLVAGHGLAAPLAIGNGLLGASYGLGFGKLGLAAPLGHGLGKAIL